MDLWSVLMAMLGSPEKRWLLAVIVLLTINTGAVLPPYVSAQAPLRQKLSSIIALALNITLLTFAVNLAPQEKPDLQQLWAVVWTGGLMGIVTLWYFLKPPKIEISAHDHRSELLGVLREEYDQRERDSVLGNSAAPVPLEPPRPIPFLGKLLGFGQERSLSGLDDLLTVFDQEKRQVLILGEPGAGKTTLLVALANRLVQRAIEDDREPIPVILELSAWRAGESLTDWVVAEVAERYRPLPAAQVANWLTTRQLLPLLDGLDELKDRQGAVMVAINEWVLQSLKLAGVVVCCRREEYDAVVAAENVTLEERINKRIELQPLDEATIRAHLHDCERDFLWAEIQQDRAGFRKLAESPLLLDLMVAAYDKPGKWQLEPPRNPHDLETHYLDCRDRLLDDYFEARLHSVAHPKYNPADTRRYLEWLARSMRDRNQTEFLIENMQPDLIGSSEKLKSYRNHLGAIAALPLFLCSWFIGLIFDETFRGLLVGIGVGLLVFAWMEILSIRISKTFWPDLSYLPTRIKGFSLFIIQSLYRREFIGYYFCAPIYAFVIIGLFYATYYAIGIKDLNHLWYLFLAMTFFVMVMIFALSAILESNSFYYKKIPYKNTNEGSKETSKNLVLLTSLFFSLFFVNQLILTTFQNQLYLETIIFRDIPVAFILSALMGFYYFGGLQILQKVLLMRFLTKEGHTPVSYHGFLQYASNDLNVLKKSGAYFRFYHELIKINLSKFDQPYQYIEPPKASLKTKAIALFVQLTLLWFIFFACLNISNFINSSNFLFFRSINLQKNDIFIHHSIIGSKGSISRNSLTLVDFRFKYEEHSDISKILELKLIGKIVQLPGEKVNLDSDYFFTINEKSIDEVYRNSQNFKSLCMAGELRVPPKSYVVLLQWADEPWLVLVKETDIHSRLSFRIYPFDRFGPIEP